MTVHHPGPPPITARTRQRAAVPVHASVERIARRIEPQYTIRSARTRHPDRFDAFVEEIRTAGTNSFAVCGDDYLHEGGLRLQQRTNEFAGLCVFLAEHRPAGAYLEIGTASGGACRFLQGVLHSAQVLSLDDGQHPDAHLQDEHLADLPRVSRYVGDSHAPAAAHFIADHLTEPLGVAVIDGDHTYDGVLQDTRLVLPFTEAGTLLVYHDTVAVRGVRRHWALGAASGLFVPVAHFVDDRPGALGIGVGVRVDGSRPATALRSLLRRPRGRR